MNLWWSIDGVNVDNTVILYPDMFGRPLQYDPKSMYLAAGVPVSKPHVEAFEGDGYVYVRGGGHDGGGPDPPDAR
jgi:hypothetical protein